ncbi:alpha/beta hydrolase [Fodinicurvata sp. EGI_FJ10296]|uniref:alpha/beta fold hydrolase n=1 Tax=Fodinicurvata sp. EGI_FJ10296 TaxID=3231908 RepID=UPI00345527BC
MFEGFHRSFVTVEEDISIHAMVGGEGPPLLLLHGYPQTQAMWHAVVPELAKHFTVVCADLRGYGASDKPSAPDPHDSDHMLYAKRIMADDMVFMMEQLGYMTFDVAGHDRGARVVHRLALDHPDAVQRAAVLDIVPTPHVFATVDQAVATAYYHWFFLIQPDGLPEHFIGKDPEGYCLSCLERWSKDSSRFEPAAVEAYVQAFSDPDTIHASCEDYRAGASVDLDDHARDAEDGNRIASPLLVLWGEDGFVGSRYDPLAVWRDYADEVTGHAIPDSGHFVAEENPEATAAALLAFFKP